MTIKAHYVFKKRGCTYYILSLYSTATQNTWRRGLALGNAPNARILRWGYQYVGILQPMQTFKFASPPTPNPKICVTPDANPQHQSVEYRWRWAFWHWGWRWACTFHVFLLISFAFCSQRKPSFQWNMGFKDSYASQNDYRGS